MNDEFSHEIIFASNKIRHILSKIDRIANSDCSILIIGETGVGKEIFAEYIHRKSKRKNHNLIKVGLATLPPNLIESELFGYEKGAFTGSIHEKKGQFELADKGTIFLDDIDDFPLHLQTKLLRVLESKEIQRIGSERTIPLDIRLICATKVDLGELVVQEKFRMDLFYRINVFPLTIPPLRERREDIPVLIKHFLKYYVPDKEIKISDDALEAFMNYSWPGNVRELRNVIQRIALFADSEIRVDNLPAEIIGDKSMNLFMKACSHCFRNRSLTFEEVMRCVEFHLLESALKEANGNYSQAARSLGMSLSTFRDKCKRHNIDKPLNNHS